MKIAVTLGLTTSPTTTRIAMICVRHVRLAGRNVRMEGRNVRMEGRNVRTAGRNVRTAGRNVRTAGCIPLNLVAGLHGCPILGRCARTFREMSPFLAGAQEHSERYPLFFSAGAQEHSDHWHHCGPVLAWCSGSLRGVHERDRRLSQEGLRGVHERDRRLSQEGFVICRYCPPTPHVPLCDLQILSSHTPRPSL